MYTRQTVSFVNLAEIKPIHHAPPCTATHQSQQSTAPECTCWMAQSKAIEVAGWKTAVCWLIGARSCLINNGLRLLMLGSQHTSTGGVALKISSPSGCKLIIRGAAINSRWLLPKQMAARADASEISSWKLSVAFNGFPRPTSERFKQKKTDRIGLNWKVPLM